MQLEVEEDLFARRRQFRDERQAAAIGELHANLIEDRAVANALDEAARFGCVSNVERDNQTIARGERARLTHL